MTHIVVVGGGIGGLSAALAATDVGDHEVTVLERAPRFAEIGAGIQIAPNGLAALEALGVGARARALGVPVGAPRMVDAATDTPIATVPLDDGYVDRFDRPYLVVHRAELHRCLFEACRSRPRITLRTDHPVVGVGQDAFGATVQLAHGGVVRADAVIGADGIRSSVRGQLLGDAPLTAHGITVYRSTVPIDDVTADLRAREVTWWVGPGCHLVSYPIAGGSLMNLAASHADGCDDPDRSGVAVPRGEVMRLFAALGDGRGRRLLAHAAGWRAWALVDRDPIPRWTHGRVSLVGDAAHPMLHYAAQGACMALEDAVALGAELAGGTPGSVAVDLLRYENRRRARTAAVTLAARDSIALWHARGAAANVRSRVLSAMSPADFYDQLAWLHGGDGTARPSIIDTTGARA